jgi:anti-anti-sigma regulatory factor
VATKRARASREQRVALGEDLRISRAREIFAGLEGGDPKATAVIDASLVAKVDAAGLQALAVCVGRWRAAGRAWRWDQPAQPLKAAARLAGLEAALGLE